MNSKKIYKQFNLVVNVGSDADIHKVVEQIHVTVAKAGKNGLVAIEVKGGPEPVTEKAPATKKATAKKVATKKAPAKKTAAKKAAPTKSKTR